MKIGIIVIFIVGVTTPVALWAMLNQPTSSGIELTLLHNAGVMIETDDVRIYIDPYNLPDNYTELPADIILVTHPHGDHYHYGSISDIETDDTVFIFPENMTTEIARHDGIGMNPGESMMVGDINITAFYMYTTAPEGYDPSHPPEANWTSYIIDIDGFTIFHAGDSKCIPEYEQLTGKINVALLPLGPGCQTMYRTEVVDAIEVIQPDYIIPIHYTEDEFHTFCALYDTQIENLGCTMVALTEYSSHLFNPTDEL